MYQRNSKPVRFEDAFSSEYVSVMEDYVFALSMVLGMYDTVVLVARKAVCLYYALVANGEIIPGAFGTKVISSRALVHLENDALVELDERLSAENEGSGCIPLGSVAVVDDVIVQGHSIIRTVEHLESLGYNAHQVVVAAMSTALADEALDVDRIYAVHRGSPDYVYRLANEVNGYIAASGVSLNIDQPIYHFEIERDKLDDMAGRPWANVGGRMPRRTGAANRTLHFDPHDFLRSRCSELLPVDAVVKARLLVSPQGATYACTLIPFVLFGEQPVSELSSVLKRMGATFCDLQEGDHRLTRVSAAKLQLAEYLLSRELARAFLSEYGLGDTEPDDDNADMVFGGGRVRQFVRRARIRPESEDGSLRVLQNPQAQSLSKVCDVVVDHLLGMEKGCGAWRQDGSVDERKTREVGLTLWDCAESVEEWGLSKDGDECVVLASLALDRLVDQGVLIPRQNVSVREGEILVGRVYRSGESFTLTRSIISATCYALKAYRSLCENHEPHPLDPLLNEQLFDLLAMLFIRWVSPELGDAVKTDRKVDIANWEPQKGALVIKGSILSHYLVDSLRLVSRGDNGELIPADTKNSLTEVLRGFAFDFARLSYRLRAQAETVTGQVGEALKRTCERMVLGEHEEFQLNAITEHLSRIRALVSQHPIDMSKLRGAIDDAEFVAGYLASDNAYEELISDFAAAGVDSYLARHVCGQYGGEKTGIRNLDALYSCFGLHVRRFISAVGHTDEGQLPEPLLEENDALEEYLVSLSEGGFKSSGQMVTVLSCNGERRAKVVTGREVGQGFDQGSLNEIVRGIVNDYEEGTTFFCFLMSDVCPIYMPASDCMDSVLDLVVPRSVREGVREISSVLCGSVGCASLVLCRPDRWPTLEDAEDLLARDSEGRLFVGSQYHDESNDLIGGVLGASFHWSAFQIRRRGSDVATSKTFNQIIVNVGGRMKNVFASVPDAKTETAVALNGSPVADSPSSGVSADGGESTVEADLPTFRVGFTFTGTYEDSFVKPLCERLLKQGFEKDDIFYYRWHYPIFAGTNADVRIRKIYAENCQHVIVLLSPDYKDRPWTAGIEWRSVRELINNRESDRVLLLAIDGVNINDIDGLSSTLDATIPVDTSDIDGAVRDILRWIALRGGGKTS